MNAFPGLCLIEYSSRIEHVWLQCSSPKHSCCIYMLIASFHSACFYPHRDWNLSDHRTIVSAKLGFVRFYHSTMFFQPHEIIEYSISLIALQLSKGNSVKYKMFSGIHICIDDAALLKLKNSCGWFQELHNSLETSRLLVEYITIKIY